MAEVSHCYSCSCAAPNSLQFINSRIFRALDKAKVYIDSSEFVKGILGEKHADYALGFTGFKSSYQDTRVAGQFLGGIRICGDLYHNHKTQHCFKYFYVNFVNPMMDYKPSAHEYLAGDSFDITKSPWMEDLIVYMSNSTDSELVKDVVAHIQPLRDAIELKVVEVFEGEL